VSFISTQAYIDTQVDFPLTLFNGNCVHNMMQNSCLYRVISWRNFICLQFICSIRNAVCLPFHVSYHHKIKDFYELWTQTILLYIFQWVLHRIDALNNSSSGFHSQGKRFHLKQNLPNMMMNPPSATTSLQHEITTMEKSMLETYKRRKADGL